jgi:hypothetical protein
MMAERAPTARGIDRFLLGIVVGAVLLMLAGVGAVFLARQAPAAPPADPASPVGVVQGYVEALRAGDADRAYGHLSRSAQAGLALDEYRRRFHRPYAPPTAEQRVLIEPITQGADRAEVRVTLSRFTADAHPLSASTSHRETTVQLVREGGAWRVSQPAEPYLFLY